MNIDSQVRYLKAKNPDGNLIHIKDAKRNVEYTCPNCHDRMIPRQGEIRTWHFAHATHVCPFDEYQSAIGEQKTKEEHESKQTHNNSGRLYQIIPQKPTLIVNHTVEHNKNRCAWYNPLGNGKCVYYRPAQRKENTGFFCAKTNPYDGPKCPVHINPADEVFKRD